jgi:hypothetical protein
MQPSISTMARAATRTRRRRNRGLLATGLLGVLALATTGCAPSAATGLPGAPGCPVTPADSFWHADVRALPVHPSSATWVSTIGTTGRLKADFGSGLWDGGPIGIPSTVVPGNQPLVRVDLGYDDSDPGPYRVPAGPNIEGGPDADGDRHVLLVDRDRCELAELWDAHPNGDGTWYAGSAARFDLRSNAMRAPGATSADAAGLPILPGLVRYEEVQAGNIAHAIRITVPVTADRYVWPASHEAGGGGASTPPMGTWLRLRASVDETAFDPAVRPIIVALKVHGAVVADNGSSWFISGSPDERWDNDLLATLGAIRGSDFQVVEASGLRVAPDSYQAHPTG